MKLAELTGQAETHLAELSSHTLIHQSVITPFLSLQNAAKLAGFNLQIASGFRSFERQRLIWNNKYSGKTVLLDKEELPVTFSNLSELERLHAILHWSALPGASRHHWGTDFDIYDPSLLPSNTQLQLTCDEYQEGGYFFKLNKWLSQNMHRYGFYRPYQVYQGGVAAEPWHISFRPIAQNCLQQLTQASIYSTLLESNILGKDLICENLPMIYKQYICNVNL